MFHTSNQQETKNAKMRLLHYYACYRHIENQKDIKISYVRGGGIQTDVALQTKHGGKNDAYVHTQITSYVYDNVDVACPVFFGKILLASHA